MPTITQVGNPSNSYTSPSIELDEFLPIVEIIPEKVKNSANNIYEIDGDELSDTKEKVTLSEHLDSKKRTFTLQQLTTEKSKLTLSFSVKQGKGKKSWFQDEDGFIEPKISIEDDTIKITSPTKLLKKYDSKIEVEIEITSEKSKEFYLDFYANDDEKDYIKGDYENVHCGRMKMIFFKKEKDIFDKKEVKLLVGEIKYIDNLLIKYKPPYPPADIPREYQENYCMQAAERGLSELLKDDKHFYSVKRGTHKHKNKIGFSGKTAIDRGNQLQALGFVKNKIEFNGYTINHKERKTIKDRNTYGLVNYSIIDFQSGEKVNLQSQIEKDINSRMGFHVYYFTVTDGFHTLLLVIDNSNTKSPIYQIYDQHGSSKTSSGSLSKVSEGIRKQTSWTFANTCLERYKTKKNNSWDRTNTYLWKIQRK